MSTVVSVSAPMPTDELQAAVHTVQRIFADAELPAGPEHQPRAWALHHTGEALVELQVPHWAVNAGGDILCTGSPFPAHPTGADPFYGIPWMAGIADPADRSRLLAQLPLSGTPGFTSALATASVHDAGRRMRAGTDSPYAQVSVLGPDILLADALAAVVLEGGPDELARAVDRFGVEVLAVRADGSAEASPAWPLPGARRPAAR
jgi:FAD:protein FMN transferase